MKRIDFMNSNHLSRGPCIAHIGLEWQTSITSGSYSMPYFSLFRNTSRFRCGGCTPTGKWLKRWNSLDGYENGGTIPSWCGMPSICPFSPGTMWLKSSHLSSSVTPMCPPGVSIAPISMFTIL